MMAFERETEIALAAARDAGELALRHFNTGTRVEEKPDHSPVTAADLECEALIARALVGTFPEDGILGEEGASRPSRSDRRWLIDPIDGTRDFVRKNSFWAVQIALEAGGQVAVGVIHFPCLRGTLHAVSGLGCFWNGVATRAAGTCRLEDAILAVSGIKSAWNVWPEESIRRLTEMCWTVRSYGASYDVAMIARGMCDIWLSGNGMIWDYAPARVIAAEAGARFLTRDGSGRIDARHCLICPPELEQALRAALLMPPAP